MKLSRRGILGGLVAAAVPVPAVIANAAPAAPKQTFAKGTVMPRFHVVNDHGHGYSGAHSHGYSLAAVMTTDYEIFDGEKFVPFNSTAGQQVIADLS